MNKIAVFCLCTAFTQDKFLLKKLYVCFLIAERGSPVCDLRSGLVQLKITN